MPKALVETCFLLYYVVLVWLIVVVRCVCSAKACVQGKGVRAGVVIGGQQAVCLRLPSPPAAARLAAHPKQCLAAKISGLLCQFSCLVSCSSQTRGVASSCNLSTRGAASNQRSCDHLSSAVAVSPLIRSTRLLCSPDISRPRHIAQARRPAVAAAAAAADDEDGGLGSKRAGDHHK